MRDNQKTAGVAATTNDTDTDAAASSYAAINRRLADRLISRLAAAFAELREDTADQDARPPMVCQGDGVHNLIDELPPLHPALKEDGGMSFAQVLWPGVKPDEGSAECALRIGRLYCETAGRPRDSGDTFLLACALAVVRWRKEKGDKPMPSNLAPGDSPRITDTADLPALRARQDRAEDELFACLQRLSPKALALTMEMMRYVVSLSEEELSRLRAFSDPAGPYFPGERGEELLRAVRGACQPAADLLAAEG